MSFLYEKIATFFLELGRPYQLSDTPPSRKIWPYMKSHLKPLRAIIIGSVVCTILAATIEVWLIQYAGQIIDLLSEHSPQEIWQKEGVNFAIAAAIITFLRPFLNFLVMAMNDIAFQCNSATLVRWRAYDHLSRQSVGWFQEDLSGRTSGRLVDIGNHVSDSIHVVLNVVAFGIVYLIGVVLLLSQTNIWLVVPLLIWLAMYIAVVAFVMPRMVHRWHDFTSAKSALLGTVVDNFSNFDTIKLFAPRDYIMNEQRMRLEDTRQTLFAARKLGIGTHTILIALEAVILVGFIGYGIWLWSLEAVSIGLVSSAIALSLRITTIADWIFDSCRWTFMRIGSLREALRTIGQPIAIPQKENAPALIVDKGDIEISDLAHHYGVQKGGLNGISLTIKAGEKIAVVGRSGAGKSTLVNLILRFFAAEKGSVIIDGQDISIVDQNSLHHAIGMVAQQAALLNRSVRDNILLGFSDVSEDALIAVAKKAQAHDFIMALEDSKGRKGYDAHVGERGVKLSGGQRQRIALARVFLKNAPILILDEATSALDSELESAIQNTLNDIMKEKTVIAIAHRLSTIVQMDRIIVLDDGKIIEQGSHDELLQAGGLYANFWHRQSGGFIKTS